MCKISFDHPTVADLIAFLSTLPPDAPFLVEDADTFWTIAKFHIEKEENGEVWLHPCSYPEME